MGRARRLRHLAVHGRHRRQPAAAAQPAVLLRVGGQLRRDDGPGTLATGFAELKPLDQPSGQVRAWDPNLRPQFTQQWNVFAERLLTPSMSANVGYVGHHATHLVTPVEGNQPLPGVGRSVDLGCRRSSAVRCSRPRRSSPTSRRPRRAAAATTTRCRRASGSATCKGVEYLASYTLSRTRTNNLGYYGSGGVAGRGRVLDEHLRSGGELRAGVLRRPAQLRVLGELRAAVRQRAASGRPTHRRSIDAILGGWRLSGIFQARSGFPITVTDGRARSLQGTARQRAAELRRRSGAVGPEHQPLARHQRLRASRRSARSATADRRRARAGLQEHRRRAGQAVQRRRQRATSSSGPRRST